MIYLISSANSAADRENGKMGTHDCPHFTGKMGTVGCPHFPHFPHFPTHEADIELTFDHLLCF
jgi:hypothetical protein